MTPIFFIREQQALQPNTKPDETKLIPSLDGVGFHLKLHSLARHRLHSKNYLTYRNQLKKGQRGNEESVSQGYARSMREPESQRINRKD